MGEKGREQPFCLWPLVPLSWANYLLCHLVMRTLYLLVKEIKPMLGK